MNTTSTEITYDTRIQDNDPRRGGRVLQATGFEGDYAFASIRSGHKHKLTRIRQDRIYADGKPRKSGWSVVR